MSLVFFEDLMAEQVALMPEVVINNNVSRKPSFGWGDSDSLRAYLAQYQENHNPLIWSVPKETSDSGIPGLYRREVELNLCAIEANTELLNEVRLNPDRSFKKILNPMWTQLSRRFRLSNITMTTDMPNVILLPNFRLGDSFETQFIWDVMKVKFIVNYSEEYTPCNS
jgi:hypothetical protein